ncbi:MAG: DEAD/DEAH box helicase [Proteobacteria bacterium]|nr:DEAD/DEAH box helicase [Pseudomonadota bacterium]
MSLEDWQIALRREFGEIQDFGMENIGQEPFYSEFLITNPETEGTYKVAIRGEIPGDNYCSCPDFSVNTLGTCKHIEFTLARLREIPGAKTALEAGFKPAYSEVYLRYGSTREVIFNQGADCPEGLEKLADRYFDSNNVLERGEFPHFEAFLEESEHYDHELRCYEDALEYIAHVRDQEKLRELIRRHFPQEVKDRSLDELLKFRLYNYQIAGSLFAAQAGRAIIADEMGLGKTIQAIAASEILARAVGMDRVLIICPTSLKYQWREEIEKFTSRAVAVIEGLRNTRNRCYDSDSFYKITNYEVVHRDRDYIKKWSPDLIILDEAQRIKNWKTRTAQSVKRLESQYVLVLTGTPLENRLEELHSIVEFVDRFRLGPLFRFLAEHRVTEEADGTGKVIGYKNLQSITETLSPVLIRRSKKEVLSELPERIEKKYFVEMTSEQLKFHEENREIVARIVAKWRRYKYLSDTDQRRLMISLQNMRMSCNSTYLLDQKTDYGLKVDELISYLKDALENTETKAVVFSQWVKTHELILRKLNGNGWGHVFFHGGVPSTKRKDMIDRFKKDPDCRLFLSTDAGGVGLNLQAAHVVVNMDLPWNPAVLEQRIGRVHRLGQHRPVHVVNFIANGTIEHGMLSLLKFKKSLFKGVLDGDRDEVFLGESQLNQFMETVEQASDSIPDTIRYQEETGKDNEEEIRAGQVTGRDQDTISAENIWQNVATAGLDFLNKIGQAIGVDRERPIESAIEIAATIVQKDQNNQPYLRIPMPRPETVQKIVGIFSQFIEIGSQRNGKDS